MASGFDRISVSWQLVKKDGSILAPAVLQTGEDQTYLLPGGGTVHVHPQLR